MPDWARRFFENYLGQLRREAFTPAEISHLAWKPFRIGDLGITGPERDLDYRKIELSPAEAEAALAEIGEEDPRIDRDFYRRQRIVLVLVPGFSHETLRNFSFHEQIERKDSPHQIVMLHPGDGDGPTREQVYNQADGLRLVYVRYPRSNAASELVVEPLFRMLQRSPTLRRWVEDEGRKLFFVGYSYGSPLTLEMLAGIQAGAWKDEFILPSALGFLGLCGDIGGSYLADDMLRSDAKLFNVSKLVDFCRRHRRLGKIAGLHTERQMDDMVGGVRSLGHEDRQRKMKEYLPRLPGHLKYFTVAAALPIQHYRRRVWHANLDDWSMYRQALVSLPTSIYNDGQVVLADNLLPPTPQIPAENNIHLGAVRTHHWGVSYRRFNFGHNRFPRAAFYRALMKTIDEAFEA